MNQSLQKWNKIYLGGPKGNKPDQPYPNEPKWTKVDQSRLKGTKEDQNRQKGTNVDQSGPKCTNVNQRAE